MSPPNLFDDYLSPFVEFERLYERVLCVLTALPETVRRDFLEDPRFQVATDKPVPGKGTSVLIPSPGLDGNASRCVVLRRRLADYPESFACYIIAHEFAHAFLRNGGWGDIDDAEEAADALAASWGFAKPD